MKKELKNNNVEKMMEMFNGLKEIHSTFKINHRDEYVLSHKVYELNMQLVELIKEIKKLNEEA